MNDVPMATPPGGFTPRYVYLISRLRGRQITMEEATELFGIMQGMIRAAQQSAPPPPPMPGAGPSEGRTQPAPPAPGGSITSALGENADWLLLLGLGAGAGLGAALVKRMSEGPPATPPTQATKSAQ